MQSTEVINQVNNLIAIAKTRPLNQLAIESKIAIENLRKSRHFKVEESKFILTP